MIDLAPLFGPVESCESEVVEFRVFPKNGPPRWMLESRFRSPWHLKTWPRAGLRARLIHRAAWTLSRIGVHFPCRKMSVPVAADSAYKKIQRDFGRIGIFLGTPGENRKLVIFAENKSESVFIKVPLGPASIRLTQTESRALTELADDKQLDCLVPKVSRVADHLAIENLEQHGVRHGRLSLAEAARFHRLLFDRSRRSRSVESLRASWTEAARSADADSESAGTDVRHVAGRTKNSAVSGLVKETLAAANDFLDQLSPEMGIDCYMAHGDFTPWNTLIAKDGTARVIDWELYDVKPRYFDLIHYFVAADILVAQAKDEAILTRLEEMGLEAESEGTDTDCWNLLVGLYFSYQALYYGRLYERQVDLHAQAIWQLEIWRNALRTLSMRQQ